MMFIFLLLVVSAAAHPAAVVRLNREPIIQKTSTAVSQNGNQTAMMPRNRFIVLSWSAYFGEPEQNVVLAFATASMQTFVRRVGFQGCTRRGCYNPDGSTTTKHIDNNFKYTEGNITVKGETYEDDLRFLEFNERTRFGAVTELEGVDRLFYDGQIGLGWKPYAEPKTGPTEPIIHSFLENTKKVFQFYTKKREGALSFGHDNIPECRQNRIHRFPLLKGKPVPMISVESFEIGKYMYSVGHPAFVDASAGSILLPDGPFRAVLKLYELEFDDFMGVYLVSCDAAQRELQLTIGGVELRLSNDEMIMEMWPKKCALAVGKSDRLGEPTYTLGMPFFYRHCLTFDVGNNQIGVSVS